MLGADAAEAAGAPGASGVRLLPAFDQYVIAATKHAGQFLEGDHLTGSTARRAGSRRWCSWTA